MTLNPKEATMLGELISQEQLCVEKYSQYASGAHDMQLKSLFNQLGQTERQHLSTLHQISGGTVPQVGAGAGESNQPAITPAYNAQSQDPNMKKDQYLCQDALSMEKYVSSAYNTSIFAFSDTNVRKVLNHIQKEEQGHGEKICHYMTQNGMSTV